MSVPLASWSHVFCQRKIYSKGTTGTRERCLLQFTNSTVNSLVYWYDDNPCLSNNRFMQLTTFTVTTYRLRLPGCSCSSSNGFEVTMIYKDHQKEISVFNFNKQHTIIVVLNCCVNCDFSYPFKPSTTLFHRMSPRVWRFSLLCVLQVWWRKHREMHERPCHGFLHSVIFFIFNQRSSHLNIGMMSRLGKSEDKAYFQVICRGYWLTYISCRPYSCFRGMS